MENYNRAQDKGPHILSPMKISTITLSVRLPYIQIWFDSIRYQFEKNQFSYRLSSKYDRSIKKSIKMSRKKRPKKAYNYNLKNNTLFLHSYLGGEDKIIKITCQIFHNGSITITGLKSIKNCVEYLHKLLDFFKSFKHDPFNYRPILEYKNPTMIYIESKKEKGKEYNIKNPERVRIDAVDNKTYGIEIKKDKVVRWIYDIKNYDVDGPTVRVGRLSRNQVQFKDTRISMLNMNFRLDVMIKQIEVNKILGNIMYSMWVPNSKSELRPPQERGPINAVEFKRDGKSRSVKILFVPNFRQVEVSLRKNTRTKLYRFPREITIIMHRSGSVMFNGAKNIDDAFNAYNFILCLIRDNSQIILKEAILEKSSYIKHYDPNKILYDCVVGSIPVFFHNRYKNIHKRGLDHLDIPTFKISSLRRGKVARSSKIAAWKISKRNIIESFGMTLVDGVLVSKRKYMNQLIQSFLKKG